MKRMIIKEPIVKCTKTQYKRLMKAENDLEKEMLKQIGIIMGCAGIALFENWGWKKKRISDFFFGMQAAWNECVRDTQRSMLEICEDETGIIVDRPDYEGNYKDLLFFQPKEKIATLSIEQRIYMRIRQKDWMGAEIFASVLVALHRKHGFGDKRIFRLKEQMDEIRDRYSADSDVIEKECRKITGIDFVNSVAV